MLKLQKLQGSSFSVFTRRAFRDPDVIRHDLEELRRLADMKDSNPATSMEFGKLDGMLDMLKQYMSKREFGAALMVVWRSEGYVTWKDYSNVFARNVVLDRFDECSARNSVSDLVIKLRMLERPFRCSEDKIRDTAIAVDQAVVQCIQELYGVHVGDRKTFVPRLERPFRFSDDSTIPEVLLSKCK